MKDDKDNSIGKKHCPLFYRKVYRVTGTNSNGTYTIQDLKWEQLPRTENIMRLKKLKMRHEINHEPDSNTLTEQPVCLPTDNQEVEFDTTLILAMTVK